jgi:hypothetical protein
MPPDSEHGPMRTITDLACELEDRGVTLELHQVDGRWVAWLYEPGEADVLARADGEDLLEVLTRALKRWDSKQ